VDIYCPRCGEPIDIDELHEVAGMGFEEAREAFTTTEGCGIITGATCAQVDDDRTALIRGTYEILGNDIDGCAATFEDMGL
jgi:hypothetical protein